MIWILAVMVPLLFLGGRYARLKTKDIRQRQQFRDEFYKSAGKLIDDDETPEEIVAMLCFMHDHVGDASAMRKVLWHWMTVRLGEMVRGRRTRVVDIEKLFAKVREPMRFHVANALICFVLGMSFNGFIAGRILRGWALSAVWRQNKRQVHGTDTAAQVVADMIGRNGGPDCLVA